VPFLQDFEGAEDLFTTDVPEADGLPTQADFTSSPGWARLEDATPAQIARLLDLVMRYRHLFGRLDTRTPSRFPPVVARLSNETPFNCGRPRPVPAHQLAALVELLERQVADGIIERLDTPSEWGHPICVVQKRNGATGADAIRLTIDLTGVNRVTIPSEYTLPVVQHVIERTVGDEVFTKFDLTDGFAQLKLAPESRKYFTFHTPVGMFVPLRMPQRWSGSPAEFMKAMGTLLYTVQEDVDAYVDDHLAHTRGTDAHLDLLERLFECYDRFNVRLKLSKAEFLRRTIAFAGFRIDGTSRATDPERMQGVRDLAAQATATHPGRPRLLPRVDPTAGVRPTDGPTALTADGDDAATGRL
jgi:hypothetical protein